MKLDIKIYSTLPNCVIPAAVSKSISEKPHFHLCLALACNRFTIVLLFFRYQYFCLYLYLPFSLSQCYFCAEIWIDCSFILKKLPCLSSDGIFQILLNINDSFWNKLLSLLFQVVLYTNIKTHLLSHLTIVSTVSMKTNWLNIWSKMHRKCLIIEWLMSSLFYFGSADHLKISAFMAQSDFLCLVFLNIVSWSV